jgi:ribosomal-protein-alanine N-acetyltransferase
MAPHTEVPGGFPAQRDLRTIHLKNLRIAAGSAAASGDLRAGEEAQFHQTAGIVGRQIDSLEDCRVAPPEIHETQREGIAKITVDTQLHVDFSIRWSEILVKRPSLFLAFFRSHRFPGASNCAKIKDNRMTPRYSIRLFRLSDLDRILEIEHASFRKDAYDRNLFADFHHKCGELFLVALDDGKICGYMLTCLCRGNVAGRAELVSVAVDPKWRGKGIATLLMASTVRRLRRRGVSRFHLMVKTTNRVAARFYEGYGFRKTRTVRGYYEDGRDGWRMEKCWDAQST